MAVAQARDFETGDLVPWHVGHVDVEDGVGGQRIGRQARDDLDRGARGGRVVAAYVVGGGQRDRHRGQAQETALHRRGDGARIDDVVAEVGGVVDARHHDVGFGFEHAGDGDVHAVGRRAVYAEAAGLELHHAHRAVEGEGVAGAAAVAVRRDHDHLMAGIAQARGEDADARGVDAVVVADKYAH
jgi:hypothetical protein